MEIFKDYAEYIVGIPSFIVATILAIWIYRQQNLMKKLSFTILANEEIINYTDDIKDELGIF
jgi:hypothetical protein